MMICVFRRVFRLCFEAAAWFMFVGFVVVFCCGGSVPLTVPLWRMAAVAFAVAAVAPLWRKAVRWVRE